jgi:hypothetical protein
VKVSRGPSNTVNPADGVFNCGRSHICDVFQVPSLEEMRFYHQVGTTPASEMTPSEYGMLNSFWELSLRHLLYLNRLPDARPITRSEKITVRSDSSRP